MANTLKVKQSSQQYKVPTLSDLSLGEIAINTFDGKMYIRRDNGTASIIQIGAGGGGGGASALVDLSDVSLSSPSSGQVLKFNGSVWVNGSALTSLNGLTDATQTFAAGTSGTDVNWSSSSATHTLNIPDASASARGLVTTGSQTFSGTKTFEASSSSAIPFIAKGAASQSANLAEWQDSSGNPVVSIGPSGTLTVAGDLTVNGTTNTINSTVTTVDDPVITLGGDTAPTVDDNKDRGIEFRYHNGTSAKVGFFGFDDSSSKFTFIPDATNSSEVFSGTAGDASFNTIESTVSTGTAPLIVASTTVVTNLNADTLDGSHAADLRVPVGTISPYAASSAPSGWLLCDGSAVSRSTYAALSSLLSGDGYVYGTGDGSTTFNLPDLRQRFPLGKAVSGTGATLGGTGGAIDHTHTMAHTHSVPAHYHTMGTGATLNITSSGGGGATTTESVDHSHSGTTGNQNALHTHGATTNAGEGAHSHTIPGTTASTNNASGEFYRSNAGTADYTLSNGGTHQHTLTTGTESAWHQHAFTSGGVSANHTHNIPNHTHSAANFSGSIGLVTGGVNGNAEMTSGAASTSTTSSGNPPFLVVNYIIKT